MNKSVYRYIEENRNKKKFFVTVSFLQVGAGKIRYVPYHNYDTVYNAQQTWQMFFSPNAGKLKVSFICTLLA